MDFCDITSAEGEFYAKNQLIDIKPTDNFDKMYLISGNFGPFKPQKPITVPLWLGIEFKKKGKCSILQPTWLSTEILYSMVQNERTKDPANPLKLQ